MIGRFHDFPPTILMSGTRDLFLSNTVRTHRKLREADFDAELQGVEAFLRAQHLFNDAASKTKEAFTGTAALFDKHLAR